MFSSVDFSSCSRYIYSFLLTEREADFFYMFESNFIISFGGSFKMISLYLEIVCLIVKKDIASGINFYFKQHEGGKLKE